MPTSNKITGKVFNIQHFSIHDGPGIRTTVFMKGCPLRCVWCHNPESWKIDIELSYNAEKCSGCGACFKACGQGAHIISGEGYHVLDRDKCAVCGACADVCYYNSLEMIGKDYTADEVIADVMRDKIFYETSNGGITLSGGEPLYQFDFACELLKQSKANGLHTCVETSAFTSRERIIQISEYIDMFLIDFKISDSAEHKKYCGVENELILSNLRALNDLGNNIVLRCPIILDINDNEAHFKAIAEIANTHDNISEVNIEPYHPLGISKNQNIGKTPTYTYSTFLDKKVTDEYVGIIKSLTDKKVIQM